MTVKRIRTMCTECNGRGAIQLSENAYQVCSWCKGVGKVDTGQVMIIRDDGSDDESQ